MCMCHPLTAVEERSQICIAVTDVDVQASESTSHSTLTSVTHRNSDVGLNYCMTLMLVTAQEAGAFPYLHPSMQLRLYLTLCNDVGTVPCLLSAESLT